MRWVANFGDRFVAAAPTWTVGSCEVLYNVLQLVGRAVRDKIAGIATLATLLLMASPVMAACGEKSTPSYSDITAIRYVRTNCFGKCPTYEVLFTREGCYYVGIANVSRHGTYESACSAEVIDEATSMLKSHQFYYLNAGPDVIVTDVPHLVIAVERCGVTTKLDWPDWEKRPDIPSLFSDLDRITNAIYWRRVSTSLRSPLPLLAAIPSS